MPPPMEFIQRTHYRVVCVLCGTDAIACPERQEDLDVSLRAVRTFERVGWHQDIDQSRRQHARNDARTFGDGRWYCPACAKRRP